MVVPNPVHIARLGNVIPVWLCSHIIAEGSPRVRRPGSVQAGVDIGHHAEVIASIPESAKSAGGAIIHTHSPYYDLIENASADLMETMDMKCKKPLEDTTRNSKNRKKHMKRNYHVHSGKPVDTSKRS